MNKNFKISVKSLTTCLLILLSFLLLTVLFWDRFTSVLVGVFFMSIIFTIPYSFVGVKSGIKSWKTEERTLQLYLVILGNLLIFLFLLGISILFILMIRGLHFK